jgi:hypothetical protein
MEEVVEISLIKAGEYFEVKELLCGQPAAMPLWATYDG